MTPCGNPRIVKPRADKFRRTVSIPDTKGMPMFAEHHDLLHEFPEHKDKIHELKTHNAHFSKLFDEYHDVDKELRRVQQEIETPSDQFVEDLKKKRLALKDELFAMISQ
jgi:uncharacterized protein YdcH (DUF465 family)